MRKRANTGKRAAEKKIRKAAKKTTARKKKGGNNERDEKEVRKECSELIKEGATLLTAAVIEEGKKGQLGPVKYLFEMANIFPRVEDGSQASAEEDSLAETLLHRLGIPTHPVVADEYEKENETVNALGPAAEDAKTSMNPEKQPSEGEVEASPDALVGCK